jgi:hypothetical protein
MTTGQSNSGRDGNGKLGTSNRKPIKKKPATPREQFAARLRKLAGNKTGVELAAAWGCTTDAALKYLRGDRIPKLDDWPIIAAGLGLDRWQDLLPE